MLYGNELKINLTIAMRVLHLMFFLVLYTQSLAQDKSDFSQEIIHHCYPDPEFNREHWTAYLENNLEFDSAYLISIPAGTYKAIIEFEIGKDGSILDACIYTDPGYGLGLKALVAVRNYKEKAVNPYGFKTLRRQPITFVIEEENEDIISSEMNCNQSIWL